MSLPRSQLHLLNAVILEGADSRRTERLCVVDEDFARRYWPKGNPLGQRLFLGGGAQNDADAFTVVGVVSAVKHAELAEQSGQGAVYVPYRYYNQRELHVVARASQSPDSLAAALRGAIREIDPELPLSDVQSMEDRIEDSLVARRSPALLASLFAVAALLLTAVGTYGVVAYAVGQRRREIGLRMALGALPKHVRNQFLGMGAKLLLAGVILGVLGSSLMARAMANLLFDTQALPPGVLAAGALLMGSTVLLGTFLPSHRASQVPPTDALQGE